jgi:prepilin-type N-terminal cleavage/methylation domain-containing protein
MKNSSSKGFSLVELLLVVVIIGILAALATAGFLASRRSANEGSAVATMRILHSAQMTYSTSLGGGEFIGSVGAGSAATLNALNQANLIDDVLGSGMKSGYNLVGGREPATATTPAQFFFSAIPISADPVSGTGSRRFGVATDGVLRADTAATSQYPDVAAVAAAPAYEN